jgi:pyruvate,water dikinase
MDWMRNCTEDAGIAEFGAKGHALARAARAGLPVPPWFAVTPAAAAASLAQGGRFAWHEAPHAALAAALKRLCPGGERVAVRSSAADEDGGAASFAGQLASFLFVAPDAVAAHVALVWRSAHAAHVRAYRERHGLGRAPGGNVPVLVQRMVDANAAGVAFSADPVSGRRGIAIVAALPGVANALVAGERDGDTWHIDRSGHVTARTTEGPAACLTDAQALAVADLARRCARHFGAPQDIEWAFEGTQLWLLQSRPITSLAARPDPDAAVALFDSSNIGESYGGTTTPLTYSFIRRAYEHVYRELCRVGGVDDAVVEEHAAALRCMVALARGRVHYNLVAWYELLALTPAFARNRRFLDEMLGVRERAAAPVLARIHAEAKARTTRLALARQVASLVVNFITVERRNRRFLARLDHALAEPSLPLSDQRADELVAHFHALDRRLLRHWDAPLVNDFFAMIFHGVLTRLTLRWLDPHTPGLGNDLVAGEPGLISVEPARRIGELARLAANAPALAALLRNGDPDAIRAALPDHPEFRQRLEAYVARFGDRCMEELKLESLTYDDDPLPLLRTIGTLAADPVRVQSVPAATDARRDAERRARVALRGHPLRRLVFGWVLRHARARLRDRENLRFERTRVFARVRRVFVELGRRLHEHGLIAQPRDVFWLELDEVLGTVDGTSTCANLTALAHLRKAEFERYERTEPPPRRFEAHGIAQLAFARVREAVPAAPRCGTDVQAIGCSPGVVRGRVRVVTQPSQASMGEGEILVAERTDPGWVVLFAAAAGLVVERGNLLSHAAIVARELRLPAVIGVAGACRWLRDGDLVEIDGSAGTVRRIAPSACADPVPTPA